jgi:hypothetical protein
MAFRFALCYHRLVALSSRGQSSSPNAMITNRTGRNRKKNCQVLGPRIEWAKNGVSVGPDPKSPPRCPAAKAWQIHLAYHWVSESQGGLNPMTPHVFKRPSGLSPEIYMPWTENSRFNATPKLDSRLRGNDALAEMMIVCTAPIYCSL